MLEFLLGTEDRAKIKEIYRRAKQDSSVGKSVFILVPEQYSMYAEQELIETLGLSAQSRIQILTFSRLSNMIFSKLGPLRTNYIDKAGKYLLATRALMLCKNQLNFFGRNLTQTGFPALIVNLISEFKRYGVTPQALRNITEKSDNQVLSAKLLELSLIYEKFNELVEENYQNAEDNLSLAMQKIPQADFLSGSLYISYFRSFTPVEYGILGSLLPKIDICVALCTDSLGESTLFAPQIASLKRLSHMAKDLGIEVKNPQFVQSEEVFRVPDLEHLKANYFEYRPAAYEEAPENIHIVRPQNYYAEAICAARIIKRLQRTKGYTLNDFLILTGAPQNYELILPSVFEEFGISCFLDQKVRLAESPFMRMIISVLEILAFGFSYTRVITIFRSGFWNISKDQCDIFENYILAADITHGQWNSSEAWVFNPDPHRFDMNEINEIKSSALNPILDLINMFQGRKTVGEIADKLCTWLNSLSTHLAISEKIDQFRTENNIEAAEQLNRVWDSFVSVINQIADCIGDTPATFKDFYEYFTSSIAELNVGIVPPTQDKVIISEVSRFRSTGSKVVLVLGVSDKVFPKSHNSEGILSDSERNQLEELGLTLAPNSLAKQKEEQFLVYSVFSTPSEELYLLSPMGDKEGNSLGASEVVKRICGVLFPQIQIENEDTELDLIEGKNHSFFELCARLFECKFDAKALSSLWQSVYACFCEDGEYSKKLTHFRDMYQLSAEPIGISKSMAKKLYGESLTLSVSKLEKYNSCAFSFFMKYGLLAEERLLGGLKATDTGSILHDVLCNYFEEKAQNGADYSKITRDQCFYEITKLVNNFAQNSEDAHFVSSNYYGYMLMRLKSIATATAWKLVKFYSKSQFRPVGFELSFGKLGELPPYVLDTPEGKVTLKGFIDRVDSATIDGTEYVTITDYKSSEKRIDPQMIDAGITLQPLIYANAVTNQSEVKKPAAMMYLQMNDPILKFDTIPDEPAWEAAMSDGLKTHGLFLDDPAVLSALDSEIDEKSATHYINCDAKSRLSAEYFEKRLKDAEICAANTAEKILSGRIEASVPDVKGFDPCSYCPYGNVCREE